MYNYTFSNRYDEELFIELCQSLVINIPGLTSAGETEFDGELRNTFSFPNGEKILACCNEKSGVSIDSDKDIDEYLS